MVLFLHGFPQTNYTWRYQLPALANAGYYCVAPNQRGYSVGARPAATIQYATALLLKDMLDLAAELSPQGSSAKIHVVGHDWGGQLSWLLAAFYPDRVKSLTVLSRPHPAAFALAMKQDNKQAGRSSHHQAFQNANSAELLLADNAKRLRKLFADQWVSDADVEAYLEVLGSTDAMNAAINWYRNLGDDTSMVGKNVPVVTIPTLYLWGDKDMSVGRAAAEKTVDFVDAEYSFVEIPDVGHFITDQLVDAVNDNLLRHLDSVENSN